VGRAQEELPPETETAGGVAGRRRRAGDGRHRRRRSRWAGGGGVVTGASKLGVRARGGFSFGRSPRGGSWWPRPRWAWLYLGALGEEDEGNHVSARGPTGQCLSGWTRPFLRSRRHGGELHV
jgi:hypothetical protein